MNSTDISMPVAKASTAIAAAVAARADVAEQVATSAAATSGHHAWTAVNAIPWGTVASIAAAVYSLLLISEWFWKKLWRPMCERQGWLKPLRHRIITVEEYEAEYKAGNTGPAPL